MELYAVITGTVVVLAVSLILKLCNLMHLKKEELRHKEALSSFDLLDEAVSYKKYKKISKRSSVPNNPIRSDGDFLDFILAADNLCGEGFVENMLSKANCGDFLDE